MQRGAQSLLHVSHRATPLPAVRLTGMPPDQMAVLRTRLPDCGTVHYEGARTSTSRDPAMCERGLVMNQRETDTSEQVLKLASKEKAQNRVAELDDAGQAIVAQIRTAADLVKEDCDRAMSLAHKLSMELRAAEDRTQQMAREVEHWQERAARAEQWLRTIQQEIEEKLLTRRSFSGAEGVAVR